MPALPCPGERAVSPRATPRAQAQRASLVMPMAPAETQRLALQYGVEYMATAPDVAKPACLLPQTESRSGSDSTGRARARARRKPHACARTEPSMPYQNRSS
ncbi:hypothetical protein ZWY2020_035420 [Hordeum vulgare]|nr:hypothetical protein ZWY2020_035420 [Hordeum vulgare]